MSPARIDTPMVRAAVEPEDRRAMTPARKRRIHEARKGKCWMCGQDVPVDGPEVRYDHRVPLELGGSDDDANLWPLHREPCDRLKTAADLTRISKMRRQKAKHDGSFPPTKAKIRSGGFRPTRDWSDR